jgi:hypothetical protein
MQTATAPSAPSYTGAIKSIEYTVASSQPDGEPHQIAVNPFTRRTMRCTCKAGHYNRQCWARKLIDSGCHTLRPRVRFGPVAVS